MSCSQCDGIEQLFDRSSAQHALRRYRRRGPDRSTRLLIDGLRAALERDDVRDGLLLDVGAGIGAIHHEILDGRVSRAVHVDASPAQLAAAREETARRGHSERVEFVSGDFVTAAERLPIADVVTLDRVICCYDDMPRLVRLSARKAARAYGAVYPREVPWMRLAVALLNLWQRVRRSEFRMFVHPPSEIERVVREAGLEPLSARRTLAWNVVVYTRRPGARAPAATTPTPA